MTTDELRDHSQIAATVGAFAWRDQGRWPELRSLFAENATIAVSWYSGPIDGFIEASSKMTSTEGVKTKHWLGQPRISLVRDRALVETDVTIMIRSSTGPVEIDITSYARFFDRLQRDTSGRWKIHSRVAIYEKDRMDPVKPSVLFWIASRLTSYRRYPAELKHLAYGLARKGSALASTVVTSGGSAERRLKFEALEWLDARTTAQLP